LPSEPIWVTPEGVVQINRHVLAGAERHVVRDRGLLESACEKPRNLWRYENQDDVAVLASCLMFALARNHPFEQGNKRTAATAMIGFLGANGFRFDLVDDVEFADSLIAVLTGAETEDSFVTSLRRVIERDDSRSWR
jgi:death-on-curing protein